MIRRRRFTGLLAASCCFLFIPDVNFAAPVAVTVFLLLERWLPRLGTEASEQQALEQRVALPLALDVLSLCLDAGVSWDRAVQAAADCCDGDLAHDLRVAAHRLTMGAAPAEVWTGTVVLRDIGSVVERSFRSGAAVSVLLRQHADGERAAERLRRIENSRRLGTKILMPVSFLGYPAFFTLALIPTLVSSLFALDLGFTSTGQVP